ncbi:TIR domain-containing protein [Butyrivibrio sp. AE3004]|uniref:TIR domain-containing protein n=1 Tax=Butyrivibrio sp. AE3004 TaxID=1506994 RepID=UPI000493FEF6|nr:TIR domain-containing protein [Butyrivibrio sp. AE3004]
MRYDAFISYRHAPLDMEVAKKIHTGLETYKIPKSVQNKTGKKKMGRVFRDQEELPIGSDLDNNISMALAESKYLIVICSPRTPESYWVCKEIDNFIKMHDRNHVLAVLIEGEPEESFPPQLLKDEEGNPVEPLAADVRGATKKERNTKYKTELLRLAAPVIGCTYDELRQRHRERVIRKTITLGASAATVVAVSGISFGIYNANVATQMKELADEKTKLADEITVQYQGKQENQSRFYAEEALSLFESGNREDAVLVAMKGLPSKEDDRPYVPEAEYALSKALYAYDSGNDISFDRNLTHSLPLSKMKRSDDATKLITIDNGNKVYVWNAEDWSLAATIEPGVNSSNYIEMVNSADADATGVYVTTDYNLIKYDYEGNVIYSKDTSDMIVSCEVCENKNKALLVCCESVEVFDPATGETVTTIPNNTNMYYKGGGKYNISEGVYVAGHLGDDAGHNYFSIIDPDSATVIDAPLSEGMMMDFTRTDNGNYAVVSANDDMLDNGFKRAVVDLIDKDGNILWTKELDVHVNSILSFSSLISAHEYQEGDENVSDIVVTVETCAITLDEKNGEVKASFNLPADATMLGLTVGSPYGRVGYKQGNIDFVDFSKGRIHSDFQFDTNDSIREAIYFKGAIVFNSFSSPDVHVLSWHEAPDAKEFMNFDQTMRPISVSDDNEIFAMGPSMDFGKVSFFDKEGKELYSFDSGESIDDVIFRGDIVYLHDRRCLWKIDLKNKNTEKIDLEKYGFESSMYELNISNDGKIANIWSSWNSLTLDLQSEETIIAMQYDGKVGSMISSADGKQIYISEAGENLYAAKTENGESTYFKDDKLRTVTNVFGKKYMALSPDGKYLAITCMDGVVRVADTESMETVSEIPMDTYLRVFMSFTKDSKHLVLQGDDYKVRIWDMDKQEIISSVDANVTLTNIICDEDSNLMAACSGYGMLLYETNNYGCVADIDRGMLYLGGEDSILISSDRMNIKRTHYKNYKELIDEAKKQFSDSVLSSEKQVKYNIN